MQKARNGKIARLPKQIREELNRRMEDGQTEGVILPWLNAIPEVQTVLAEQFGSSRITQQNLSNWRLGGYQDWLQHQQHNEVVREVALDADKFNRGHKTSGLAANLSNVMLAEMALSIRDEQKTGIPPRAQFERLQEMLDTVCKVRQEESRNGRLALDRNILEFDAIKMKTSLNQVKQTETRCERNF